MCIRDSCYPTDYFLYRTRCLEQMLFILHNGKMVGSIADFSSFSFHAVKNLTTAEGGALTWNIPGIDDEELYHQAQLYSLSLIHIS